MKWNNEVMKKKKEMSKYKTNEDRNKKLKMRKNIRMMEDAGDENETKKKGKNNKTRQRIRT